MSEKYARFRVVLDSFRIEERSFGSNFSDIILNFARPEKGNSFNIYAREYGWLVSYIFDSDNICNLKSKITKHLGEDFICYQNKDSHDVEFFAKEDSERIKELESF